MGQRGPKPLPANVHALRGNPSKLPLGKLTDQVTPPVEIPSCPRHLGEEARKEWRRIAPHLEQLGLISQIDRAALAAYCALYGDWVWAEERLKALNADDPTGERGRIGITPSGYQQISVVMQIRNRSLEMMAKYLAEFGLSPSARSRVTAGDPQLGLPGMDKPAAGGWGDVGPRSA